MFQFEIQVRELWAKGNHDMQPESDNNLLKINGTAIHRLNGFSCLLLLLEHHHPPPSLPAFPHLDIHNLTIFIMSKYVHGHLSKSRKDLIELVKAHPRGQRANNYLIFKLPKLW